MANHEPDAISSRFLVLLDHGQRRGVQGGGLLGRERLHPRVHVLRGLADEREAVGGVEAALADDEAGEGLVAAPAPDLDVPERVGQRVPGHVAGQAFHAGVPEVEDAQGPAHLLLGVHDGEVLQ